MSIEIEESPDANIAVRGNRGYSMDDFTDWHRKTGVALLLIACVFMAGWVRSYDECDEIPFPIGHGHFESTDGEIQSVRRLFRNQGNGTGTLQRTVLWHVPYWAVTLPLTAISGWLLMIKPRSRCETHTKGL